MLLTWWKGSTSSNNFERFLARSATHHQGHLLCVNRYRTGHKCGIDKISYFGKSYNHSAFNSRSGYLSKRWKLVCSSSDQKDFENPSFLDSSDIEEREGVRSRLRLHLDTKSLRRAGMVVIRTARILGRRQVGLAGINVLTLLLVLKILSNSATSAEHVELFYLYFQPFAPFLFMLWGWGLNVLYFERAGWKYDLCFGEKDRKYLLHASQILQIANILTCGVLTSGYFFLSSCVAGNFAIAGLVPPVLYVCALLTLLLPLPILFKDVRKFFTSTMWRVMTPVRSVSWADFLLADILTSLAKGLSDVERAICSMVTGASIMSPDHVQCSDASWIIPIGVALPYGWRLMQCIRVYWDTGNRQQLINALKYLSAFPVVFLSFAKYHVSHDMWVSFWRVLWLASALFNSMFSFFWDVERDWEISYFSQIGHQKRLLPRPVLPNPTNFSRRTFSYLMVSNGLLRLSWTYKLSPHLRRDHNIVFLIVLLEAFRRFQWIFVRFEVEMRKMQSANPELYGTLVPGNPQKKRHSVGLPTKTVPILPHF